MCACLEQAKLRTLLGQVNSALFGPGRRELLLGPKYFACRNLGLARLVMCTCVSIEPLRDNLHELSPFACLTQIVIFICFIARNFVILRKLTHDHIYDVAQDLIS